MTRSVIDTNVLIRALIRPLGTVGPIVVKLQEGKYQIVYSRQLLDELTEKMQLPRIRNKYPVSKEFAEIVPGRSCASVPFFEICTKANVCVFSQQNGNTKIYIFNL